MKDCPEKIRKMLEFVSCEIINVNFKCVHDHIFQILNHGHKIELLHSENFFYKKYCRVRIFPYRSYAPLYIHTHA